MKPKDAKKMKREKLPKVSSAVASCYGCGAPLQTSEMDAPGYIDPDIYQLVSASNCTDAAACLMYEQRLRFISAQIGNRGLFVCSRSERSV